MPENILELKKDSYQIFNAIAKSYDLLNHTFSMGIDKWWRHVLKSKLPQKSGLKLMDLACGTGDGIKSLLKDDRISSIIGVDPSRGMLDIARSKLSNSEKEVTFKEAFGENLPFEDNSLDVVTIMFGIRNMGDMSKALGEINRVLGPNGRLLIMEFSTPKNILIKVGYSLYFKYIMAPIGNLISGSGNAYRYFFESVKDFPSGDRFLNILDGAGFKILEATPLTFGICTIYKGTKGQCSKLN